MMISTKGRYALSVLIDLAEHQAEGFIPLKEIAQRQDISEKYLEIILRSLVKARVITGLRGKGGGYRLTGAPEQCTVGTVLRLTENSLAPVACVEDSAQQCPKMAQCRTLAVWRGLDRQINDYLDGITIADLAAQAESGDDYVI